MALYKVVIAVTPYEIEESDEVGQPMDLPTELLTKYVVTDEEELISSVIDRDWETTLYNAIINHL
jgi:hypothetical protein